MEETPPPVPPIVPPPVLPPSIEAQVAAVVQTLSGLPADRSGPVHWDHVQRVLYVPNP